MLPSSDTVPDSEDSQDAVPYRVLWLTVLWRAVKDAAGTDLMPENPEDAPWLVKEAREWLCSNEETFQLVCELARIDGKRLLTLSREKYATKST